MTSTNHAPKSNEAKKALFDRLVAISVLKGDKSVTTERVKMYCEKLTKYDQQKIYKALDHLEDTLPKFPDISHILNLINPPMDYQDKGNEVVGAIMDALKTYGQYQAREAKEYLGAVAWFVVERFGGWNILCNMTYDELGTARAQLRDMAKVAIKVGEGSTDSSGILPEKITAREQVKSLQKIDFKNVLT